MLARRTVLSSFSSKPILSILFFWTCWLNVPLPVSLECSLSCVLEWDWDTRSQSLSHLICFTSCWRDGFLEQGNEVEGGGVVAGAASWHCALVNWAGSTKTGVQAKLGPHPRSVSHRVDLKGISKGFCWVPKWVSGYFKEMNWTLDLCYPKLTVTHPSGVW